MGGVPQYSKDNPYLLNTLCWACGNVYNGCSWFRDGHPVPGWRAERKDLYIKSGCPVESYAVFSCPEFVRDWPDSLPFSVKDMCNYTGKSNQKREE